MSSSSTPRKVTLQKSSDWDLWISMVKIRAHSHNIWSLIDPSLPAKPECLQNPIEPIIPIVTNDADTNAAAFSLYKLQLSTYKISLSNFEKQCRAFADINAFITETITLNNAVYIQRTEPHPYNILVALKQKLAPSDQARSRSIEQEYQRLIKGPGSNQDPEKWLEEFIRTYALAKDHNIGEVIGDRPIRDFLVAIKSIDHAFYTTYMIRLEENPNTLDLFTIAERFQHIFRLDDHPKTSYSHSSFSANSAPNSAPTFRGVAATPLECLCGVIHWWADCEYLNPSIQPPGWRPNPKIQQKINDLLKYDARLKERIEYSINKRKEIQAKKQNPARPTNSTRPPSPSPDSSSGVYPVAGLFPISFMPTSTYDLNSSWILDHGSNMHLCNHTMKDRFIKERNGNGEKIAAGNQFLEIEAYGSIEVHFQGENGKKRSLTLSNVIYISDFMTNIVSGSRLAAKGLHFDTYQARLHMNGNTIGYAPMLEGHYFMERNSMHQSITSTSASSAITSTSASSATTSKSASSAMSSTISTIHSEHPTQTSKPPILPAPTILSKSSPPSIESFPINPSTSLHPTSIDPPSIDSSSMPSISDPPFSRPSIQNSYQIPLCAYLKSPPIEHSDSLSSKIPLFFSSYSASNPNIFINPTNIPRGLLPGKQKGHPPSFYSSVAAQISAQLGGCVRL